MALGLTAPAGTPPAGAPSAGRGGWRHRQAGGGRVAMRPARPLVFAAAVLLASLAHAPPAAAYEFEVRARTVGQGYELRSLRLSGPDLRLDRRRFTQVLSLGIFDIGDRRHTGGRGTRSGAAPAASAAANRPRISFSGYLRIDHDFGPWATGSITQDRVYEAVDRIPELEHELLNLDVLFAYVAAEDLAGGRLDLYLGRQLDVDTLDWWSMDGVTARLRTDLGVAVEVFGGLRVRDASPAGAAALEPDGTGSGECAEYVEGAVPGSGAWRPIDRPTPMENSLFTNDYDLCPQREQPMPTAGAAVETTAFERVWARLAYRRSMSPTPGLIGPVDRFDAPDTGLYPDESGQAPGWGVNEERVAASARANLMWGRAQLTPHAAGRYDLLVGTLDEVHAGVRVRRGAHAVEPEVYYSMPVFDGDSIFNVFASDPFVDLRVTYDLRPAGHAMSGFARAWTRRFLAGADGYAAVASGAQLGAGYRPGAHLQARLDLFHEDGYGGGRSGGYGAAFWQVRPSTGVRARASVVRFDDEAPGQQAGSASRTTLGMQLGASYRINHGVMVHLMAEQNVDSTDRRQLRLLGVLDLALVPAI